MVEALTAALLATLQNSEATPDELADAGAKFFQDASGMTLDEANQALAILGEHLDLEDDYRAAYLAVICGALVEQGCDAEEIVEPLLDRITLLLKAAASINQACFERMPELDERNAGEEEEEDEDDGDHDEESGEELDDDDAVAQFEAIRSEIAATMPDENDAWEALKQGWYAAIAVLSVSPRARELAQDLAPLAEEISQYHEGGHWIRLILTVLDQEPIIVIEPESGRGIVGCISGVVDNFQLNVLIMDAFPNSGKPRIAQQVADCAKGRGEQEIDGAVTGAWNLYSWKALQGTGKLPSSDELDSTHWIWNEGCPADIPAWDGHRVVLLGPINYERVWEASRMFDRLKAKLAVEKYLSPSECEELIREFTES
ncbi:MAG: hypothetical protein AAF483_08350 [Planctomycetota bacterium]